MSEYLGAHKGDKLRCITVLMHILRSSHSVDCLSVLWVYIKNHLSETVGEEWPFHIKTLGGWYGATHNFSDLKRITDVDLNYPWTWSSLLNQKIKLFASEHQPDINQKIVLPANTFSNFGKLLYAQDYTTEQYNYCSNPKYLDTLTPYHTCPVIWMSVKFCCVWGKQCRPRSNAAQRGVWSGSTLFANACLSEYLG